MAIGADRSSVLRMVLGQGITLTIIGLVLGLVASVGAGFALDAAFPSGGEDPGYLGSLLMVVPVVLSVTLLAAYIPARRASRVNPMTALRYE